MSLKEEKEEHLQKARAYIESLGQLPDNAL